MRQFLLQPVLLLASICHPPSGTLADDAIEAAHGKERPVLAIRGAEDNEIGERKLLSLKIEVSNPSKSAWKFIGYPSDSFLPPLEAGRMKPIYEVEVKQDGEWQPQQGGFCATGLERIELPAEIKATFEAVVLNGDWQSVRVRLGFFRGSSPKTDIVVISHVEASRDELEEMKEKRD